jgi:hypothetical protein
MPGPLCPLSLSRSGACSRAVGYRLPQLGIIAVDAPVTNRSWSRQFVAPVKALVRTRPASQASPLSFNVAVLDRRQSGVAFTCCTCLSIHIMLASSTVSFMPGALLHAAVAGTGGETRAGRPLHTASSTTGLFSVIFTEGVVGSFSVLFFFVNGSNGVVH